MEVVRPMMKLGTLVGQFRASSLCFQLELPALRNFRPQLKPSDRARLVALYNATDGSNWANNTNWLSDRPLGEWHGITTDANGRVTELNLPDKPVVGEHSAAPYRSDPSYSCGFGQRLWCLWIMTGANHRLLRPTG